MIVPLNAFDAVFFAPFRAGILAAPVSARICTASNHICADPRTNFLVFSVSFVSSVVNVFWFYLCRDCINQRRNAASAKLVVTA